MRRITRLLRALTALAAALVVLAGTPLALALLGGNPLPAHVPTFAEVGHALTTQDSGANLFLHTLVVVGWIVWATFAAALLVEARAQVRGHTPRRLPAFGAQQRVAALLITAIVSGFSAPVAAVAAPAHAAPAAVVTTTHASAVTSDVIHQVTGARGPASITTQMTRPAATAPVYVVASGDWLWHIADRFLGDPNRYAEIAALNPQLEHADHRFPDHIERTWQLRLPADAHDRGARAHATGHLLIPTAAAPAEKAQPAPTQPVDGGDSDHSANAQQSPAAITPASPALTSPTPTTPTPSASPAATSPAPSASPAAARASVSTTDVDRSAEDDGMLDTALVIGVPLVGAGLLAALVLASLRRRRRQQEQHRPVGRRLPDPVNPTIEKDLRVVAQPVAVDRLDQALRVLAAGLVDRPAEEMPDIVGAWIDGDDVNLLLTAACPNPPAPWGGDDVNWTLPGSAELPDVDGQLAPLPTLVAVGSQPGMHLLLDLERLGLLAITGDVGRAGDLVRYIAAELSSNAWSDHVEVTIAGFDADETDELLALGGDRIDAAAGIAAAIERIRRRAGQVAQSLEHLGAADPLVGRIGDIAADAWMPHILLVNNPSAEEIAALETLDSDVAAIGRCAVAVVVTGCGAIGRWPVSIDPAGRLTIAFLGMTDGDASLTAAGLPRTELRSLADLLTAARAGTPSGVSGSEPTPVDEWATIPPSPEPEPWAAGTDAAGGLLDEPDQAPGDQPAARDVEADEIDPTDDDAPAETSEPAPIRPAPAIDAQPVEQTPPPAQTEHPHADDGSRVPAVVALAGGQTPTRKRITTPARRRHNDPTLDGDVRAWNDADPQRPCIAILGPVTVDAPGQIPPERLRFYAEIITYLAVRGQRGASTDQLDEALWPGQQVKATSRRVAVARARRWLGETADGEAWLPDATGDRRYRLHDGYLLDWHLFRRLRSRGEDRGPAGISDLRQALMLVRGTPFAGADLAHSVTARNPYTWLAGSEVQPHHVAAAIVDTAHRMVELCLDGGDIAGARWAVDQAWLADTDRTSDIAWRDLMRVAAAEGNSAELDQLLGELMHARDAEVPEDLDRDTYRLLYELLPHRIRVGVG